MPTPQSNMRALASRIGGLFSGKEKGGSGYGPAEEADKAKEPAVVIEKFCQRAEPLLTPLHRQWIEFVMWFYGEQYLEYSSTFGRLINPPLPGHIPKATHNLILDTVEREMSYILDQVGKGHVVPENSSLVAAQAAKTADRVLEKLWDDDDMDLKLRTGAGYLTITGNLMMISTLDGADKPQVHIPLTETVLEPDPTTGEPTEIRKPILNEDGTPKVQSIRLTDVTTQVANPMEIIPDLSVTEPYKMRQYVHCPPMSRETLVSIFGSKAKTCPAEKDAKALNYYQMKLLDLISRASYAGQAAYYGLVGPADRSEDEIVVPKYLYKLPCDDYPEGVTWVVCGGNVLHKGKYEYGERLNLHWTRYSVMPGTPWGFGIVRNLMEPQKRYNGMLTQSALVRKKGGYTQFLVPRGVGFSENEGSNDPRKNFYWNPKSGKLAGHKPEKMPVDQVSGDLWRELDLTKLDHDRISGHNDVLRGVNPPGVGAGVSLELLSEQASGRKKPHVKEFAKVLTRAQEMRLSLVPKSGAWALGKKFMIEDEDGVPQLLSVKGADLPANPQIKMEPAPATMFVQTLKKQDTLKALEAGLIDVNSARNRQMLRELLGAAEYDDASSSDIELAEWENREMVEDRPVAPRQFENSQLHMDIHRRLTLKPEYEEWPQERRQAIENHILATQARIADMLKAQMPTPEEEAALAGGGGGEAQGGVPGVPNPQGAAAGGPPRRGAGARGPLGGGAPG